MCTDVDVGAGADRSAVSWAARKQHTIDALADADPSAARVLVADKLHNVRSVLTDLAEHGPDLWERFNAGRDDQLWYYAAVAEVATSCHARSRLARELAGAVERLEEAAYTATAPRNPSDWDPRAPVANPCVWRHPFYGHRCRRSAGHRGQHARSPRPGDR